MNNKLVIGLISLITVLISCNKDIQTETKSKTALVKTDLQLKTFTLEMEALKNFFQIPGLAISIQQNDTNLYHDYLGFSDIENKQVIDSTHVFPIASLTKIFSAVLVMKLVEDKKLSLEAPMINYVPKSNLNDSILVKHILSHTSEGKIGERFHYSNRFRYITQVIEKASGKSFSEYMTQEIVEPLGLKHTFLLKDSTQLTVGDRKIAKPYILDNGIEEGFIDFGYSSSAGLVSNLKDLTKFDNALNKNTLISEASKEKMFTAFKPDLPYGYGIFSQKIEDKNIVWGYGQYDCYSSLFLKVPSENMTLIILANSSLLSDPPRLINGDVTYSLFALSFLKNFVLNKSDVNLLETTNSIDTSDINTDPFSRKKLQAQALSEAYMARFDTAKLQKSSALLDTIFSGSPDYLEYSDLNLLHNLSFLKDVAFYKDLGEFNTFDTQIENIGKKLFLEDNTNPYVNTYLGTYYGRKGNTSKAKYHFEKITKAKNYTRNWYTKEAEQWLEEMN